MSVNEAAHILLVEDEPAIAELLRFCLEAERYRVSRVENVEQALAFVEQDAPDLILLDWMLPDGTGIDLLRAWRKDRRTVNLPVVMLTAKSIDDDKVMGLDAGADDYITKPFSPRELTARIRALLRPVQRRQETAVRRCGILLLDEERHRVQAGDQVLALGQVEFRMLNHMLEAPGRIFSRNHLLNLVWGDQASVLDERTVDVHIMRLRKALGPAADYLKTVRGAGYRLTDQDDAP